MHGLRSRSSSANSSSESTSPTNSPHMNSLVLQCHDSLKNWSISVPTLNAERQLEKNCLTFTNKYDRVRNHTDKMNSKEHVKENEIIDKFNISEQSEKKFNSKELIQKQKNWTSHFSKIRTSRYNSDPNTFEVQTSLNETVIKNTSDEGLQQSLRENYRLENNKRSITQLIENIIPAERSASFSAMLISSKSLSSPPPLPTRYSSNGEGKQKKNVDFTCSSSDNNEFPKSGILNAIPNNSEKEIPEYAVVQKNVIHKKVDNLPIISLTQCQIDSKINFKSDAIHTFDYEITQRTDADPKNHIANEKVHVIIDHTDHLLSTTIKIPPKTSEWKNKWLATNEEISNDVTEFNSAQNSFNKSSTATPSKDNKEEKDKIEASEKIKYGM